MIYTVSIAIYLLALVGVGIYKTKMVKSSEDFMVAGRILPGMYWSEHSCNLDGKWIII